MGRRKGAKNIAVSDKVKKDLDKINVNEIRYTEEFPVDCVFGPKHPITGAVYVGCRPNERGYMCATCGWNPVVAQQRLAKIKEKLGGCENNGSKNGTVADNSAAER